MSNKGLPKSKRSRPDGAEHLPPVERKSKVQRSRIGRPSIYDRECVATAAFMAQQGATDSEIAAEIGISRSRFYVWCNQYPEFRDAVKSSKVATDDRVERTLLERASGYYITTEKVFSNGTRATVQEFVPPDTTAMIFWLKNRRPEAWRDRKETELIVPVDDQQNIPGDDTRQLALAALALISEAAYDPQPGGPMIEAAANSEEQHDGYEDEEPGTGGARGRGEPEEDYDPLDPEGDFELDD